MDIFDAVENYNVDALIQYIRDGGDVNITNNRGNSLLIYALLDHVPDKDIVLSLINAGANVNAVDGFGTGDTPLHYALMVYPEEEEDEKDKIDIIKALFANGADLHIKNEKGKSPFDMAISDTAADLEVGVYSPYYSLFTDEIDRRKEEEQKLYALSLLRSNQNLALARGMEEGTISSLSGDLVESIAQSLSKLNPEITKICIIETFMSDP